MARQIYFINFFLKKWDSIDILKIISFYATPYFLKKMINLYNVTGENT